MISDLISLIFPQNCINCQRSLISAEKYLCTACKIDLPFTNDHQFHDNDLFQKFTFESKVVGASSYLFFYRGGITQKLLHNLKYKGKQGIGEVMGLWYAGSLKNIEADIIIPVPLHKSKKRKRGFNQSEAFACGLASKLDIEVVVGAVERIIPTSTQTRKTKVERWQNLENVYSEASTIVEGKKILLVDDVITTGATVGMLCTRLIEAGCESIYIACIARGK